MKRFGKRIKELLTHVVAFFMFAAITVTTTITVYADAGMALIQRQSPFVGDSAGIILWVLAGAVAFGGVITSLIMLICNRKKKATINEGDIESDE